MISLNESSMAIVENWKSNLDQSRVVLHNVGGATVIDAGIVATGGLVAGQRLAEVCLAGLASITISLDQLGADFCPKVTVSTDWPIEACLYSQYAGWKLSVGKFFAMASGPMRAIAAREPIFTKLEFKESAKTAVGVLETSKLPTPVVIASVAQSLELPAERLTLLCAKTASIAGSFQVVARSVETCLHKLVELGFDVRQIRSAIGSAFLPPIPADDLTAIGRTNDSILYGGEVLLFVDAEDDAITAIGPQTPACSSVDYGLPFSNIFQRYGGDFYRIDPMLFSPARVTFLNQRSGKSFCFGKADLDLLRRSWFGDQ